MTNKDLYWQNNQTPASRRHRDIYFSPHDGLMESHHVFLKGILAPKIWQKKDLFTLLENGFGTGLNFIMTCHEWLRTAPPNARMTYIATEKYPLANKDIDRALANWPELLPEKQELLDIYPPSVRGFHQRELFGGRIKLLLLVGDSSDCLSQLDATVDAFYLDGFAPRNNPDMWSEKVFAELARLAAPKAPLATFTAAGSVRRGLAAVGFKMHKAEGFGKKRESLHGVFMGGVFKGSPAPNPKPWYHRPVPMPKGSSIAVIGGGIAGLTTGAALQKMGYQVTLFEKDSNPMTQASGNPAVILDPFLAAGDSSESVFYRSALIRALDYFHSLGPEIFLHKGLTKIPRTPEEKEKFARLLEQTQLPPELMNPGPDGALHFPDCGALSPAKIRHHLARKLTLKTATTITCIDHDHRWSLYCGEDVIHESDAVVICGGPTTVQFPETKQLPLDPVRGQITLMDAENIEVPLHNVICGKAHIIPPFNLAGRMTMAIGASFTRNNSDTALRRTDLEENLANARLLWPEIKDMTVTGGRCAIRAYSPDHLPLCGPVPDFTLYQSSYEMLKHGPKHQKFDPAPYQPNLYVVAGLGARGFLTAPLLADTLAALIAGCPLPVTGEVYESLHPGRFMIRKLVKDT